jgi:hypothetical protein
MIEWFGIVVADFRFGGRFGGYMVHGSAWGYLGGSEDAPF